MCRLFDDSGLVIALGRFDEVFGPQIDDDLRGLLRVLQRVGGNRPPQQLLDDPLVAEAGERAAAILTLIDR